MIWTERMVINAIVWAGSVTVIMTAIIITRNPVHIPWLAIPAGVTVLTYGRALDWLDNVVAAVVKRIEGKKGEKKNERAGQEAN